jgi:hypothetical protein
MTYDQLMAMYMDPRQLAGPGATGDPIYASTGEGGGQYIVGYQPVAEGARDAYFNLDAAGNYTKDPGARSVFYDSTTGQFRVAQGRMDTGGIQRYLVDQNGTQDLGFQKASWLDNPDNHRKLGLGLVGALATGGLGLEMMAGGALSGGGGAAAAGSGGGGALSSLEAAGIAAADLAPGGTLSAAGSTTGAATASGAQLGSGLWTGAQGAAPAAMGGGLSAQNAMQALQAYGALSAMGGGQQQGQGGPQQPQRPPDVLTPIAPTRGRTASPYGGDASTYGQGPAHSFFGYE